MRQHYCFEKRYLFCENRKILNLLKKKNLGGGKNCQKKIIILFSFFLIQIRIEQLTIFQAKHQPRLL